RCLLHGHTGLWQGFRAVLPTSPRTRCALYPYPRPEDRGSPRLAKPDRQLSRRERQEAFPGIRLGGSIGGHAATQRRQSAGRTIRCGVNKFNFCGTTTFQPAETSREGIFVAGPFAEPKDIPETVMQASAAAAEVLSLLRE